MPGHAQVYIGGFTGAYNRGAGGHPFVFLAVGGRLGVRVAEPASVELEALHVPARVAEREVDLFAYRGNVTLDFNLGEVEPFFLLGFGFQQWRRWMCEGSSCASPPGDGRKFEYEKGAGYTAGIGSRFRVHESLSFRIDARFEHSAFVAPTNDDWMGTIGVEVRP